MNLATKIGILGGLWGIGSLISLGEKKNVVKSSREYSNLVNKPIINVGCGLTEYGDVNVDKAILPVKNFVQGDVENLYMFRDKEFAVCIASHVIEHAEHPNKAFSEMQRVADKVYILYPPWYALGAWLTPTHKWIVSKTSNGLTFTKYNPLIALSIVGLWIVKK